MTMPAGRYYVGDLCYVMSDDAWNEVYKIINGEFILADGRKIATYRTRYGDGEFYSNIGTVHCVDSGSIGCILESDIKIDLSDKNLSYYGAIIDFGTPFETNINDGIIQFGFLEIDTDPVFDEDY